MSELPPELEGFATLLGAQTGPTRDAFAYCICLMMVETKRMRLVETIPAEVSPICIFETTAGDTFCIPRPQLSMEQEVALIDVLRIIFEDEGLL